MKLSPKVRGVTLLTAVFWFGLLFAPPQNAQIKFGNPGVGVQLTYPAAFQIIEQSQSASGCTWFVSLASGDVFIRINLTPRSFEDEAVSAHFSRRGSAWFMDGKPAKMISKGRVKGLEGTLNNSDGRTDNVTLVFKKNQKNCSAVFYSRSLKARKSLYQIAESFKFTR